MKNCLMYDEMRHKFLTNKITEKQWNEFCMLCLDELMKCNKEQLERMKNK